MTGPEVRNILKNENLHLKDVAQMLGMTQPNFTQLLQVKDVKTGLLEKMCDVLDKKMDFSIGIPNTCPLPHLPSQLPMTLRH